MVSAVGIESARQRNSNDLQRSRWHVSRSFRCSAVGTAGKTAGGVLLASSLRPQIGPMKLPCERFGDRLLFDDSDQALSSQDLLQDCTLHFTMGINLGGRIERTPGRGRCYHRRGALSTGTSCSPRPQS
jgi:hypothetical protein